MSMILIKFFSKEFLKNYNLDFALHPDHKNFNFHKYQNIIKLNSESQILKYDYVISYFSTLILLSLCCGIKSSVFSLKKEKFQFKMFKKFGLKFSNNLSDIKNFLFSRLSKNNNELKKIHFFQPKFLAEYIKFQKHEKKKKIYIILGMHRSGTSVFTRSLKIYNLNYGKDLGKPRKITPKVFLRM